MYEVELKAVLNNIKSTLDAIAAFDPISKEEVIYESLYFDSENKLTESHKELRLRIIKNLNSETKKTILTYKDPPFDIFSRSKPEFEIDISNASVCIKILERLGYQAVMHFEKRCTNYQLEYQGLDLLITHAFVEELNQHYLEVESPTVDENEFQHRFTIIKTFLSEIGVKDEDLTNEYYSEAIMKKRSNG